MTKSKDGVGRLETLPIREVFRHEAQDFTTWLESHIEVLAERLGIELNVEQREKGVGDFKVDLLCENSDGNKVIIEDQLEKTDHDHLGKLLTYLVNLDATTAIWITSEPRPEHQRVIDWLNESTGADISFYLVKVEGARIDDSPVAPLFTILAGPDPQTKQLGEGKKEWAERHYQRAKFWETLIERSRERTRLFSNIKPTRVNWIRTGAGKTGISFHYSVYIDAAAVDLSIDKGKDSGAENKRLFDLLHAQKEAIESDFGGELEWQRLDDRRYSRILKRITDSGLTEPDKWPELQDKMIDAMIRLDRALRKRVAKL